MIASSTMKQIIQSSDVNSITKFKLTSICYIIPMSLTAFYYLLALLKKVVHKREWNVFCFNLFTLTNDKLKNVSTHE